MCSVGVKVVWCFSGMLLLALFVSAVEYYYTKDGTLDKLANTDVVDTHPGLTLLLEAPEFHSRYVNTTSHRSLDANDKTINKEKEDPKIYLVLWYNTLEFLRKRPQAMSKDFSQCEYNNCQLTFNRSLIKASHAVLFNGRNLRSVPLRKGNGQVWIFAAHESQALVEQSRLFLLKPYWKGQFNWTMTFDKRTSDIWLPYGEIKKRSTSIQRDFRAIANEKTRGAIIITSHCETKSKRLQYVHELMKHTDVTVLGNCGTKWDCGVTAIHDNCFDILNNTFAFYLAFENALCDQYFTEKLFENFKYDILIVTRGGWKNQSSSLFPKGAVISTGNFTDVKHLGSYLTHLRTSKEEYAKRLEEKSKYYAVDYADIYQQALCDLCYRLNHQQKFYKIIPDILRLFSAAKSCTMPRTVKR